MARYVKFISYELIWLLNGIFVLSGYSQSTVTISFSIPSRGTEMKGLVFHQEIEGVILHSEDTTSTWQLYQKSGTGWKPQLSQIEKGMPNTLYGRYDDSDQKGQPIQFKWQSENAKTSAGVKITDNGQSFDFVYHDSLLISYRYKPMPVPEGVSQIFSRSGFVHPLKTLKGNLLTRIQPPDHHHHYGLWHPWTHTEYRGEEIDFWNLVKEQGTVRFHDVVSIQEGPLFSEITVVQDHIVHPGRGEQTVLKELLTYRLWAPVQDQATYILDVIYRMNPSTDYPLTIKEYRYEGFSLRGPAHWNDDNVVLLTSEGKDKSNGNATRARWMKVTGAGNRAGVSTIAMLTHPANYNFPELIRIWPTGTNGGKENVFMNFNPTQDRDWVMKPGQTYTLQYRVVVSDDDLSAGQINEMWRDYSGREVD